MITSLINRTIVVKQEEPQQSFEVFAEREVAAVTSSDAPRRSGRTRIPTERAKATEVHSEST